MKKVNMLKLVLAEDNLLQRLVLKGLIKQIGGFDLLLEAENGADLLKKIESSEILPEICITDLHMPVMDGLSLTKILKAKYPSIIIFCFTSDSDSAILSQLIDSGARFIFSKEEPLRMLLEILRFMENQSTRGVAPITNL